MNRTYEESCVEGSISIYKKHQLVGMLIAYDLLKLSHPSLQQLVHRSEMQQKRGQLARFPRYMSEEEHPQRHACYGEQIERRSQ